MVKQVARNGKTPKPTITAPTVPFTKTMAFSDGLALKVIGVHQGVQSGQGPGVMKGEPTTQVQLRFTNGTKKDVDLTRVVVQMSYGSPARVAAPVYDATAMDFSTVLKPGGSASASYVFSVPVASLNHVTMTVDLDGVHATAAFVGPAR